MVLKQVTDFPLFVWTLDRPPPSSRFKSPEIPKQYGNETFKTPTFFFLFESVLVNTQLCSGSVVSVVSLPCIFRLHSELLIHTCLLCPGAAGFQTRDSLHCVGNDGLPWRQQRDRGDRADSQNQGTFTALMWVMTSSKLISPWNKS